MTARTPTLLTMAVAALAGVAPHAASVTAAARCSAPGPGYYAFELVTTRNLPGTGLAKGIVEVSFSPASPFAVSLAADGSYAYELSVALDRTRTPAHGTLVAWVTTPDLASVERLGPLDEDQRVSGRVTWNKFLVVITLESSDDPKAERWRGPVAFRGMSRSGMMHTMVGHGAFQQENCAAYGY